MREEQGASFIVFFRSSRKRGTPKKEEKTVVYGGRAMG